MSNKYFLVFLAFLFSVSVYSQHGRHRNSLISGRVMSTEKEVVDFATVYLKGTNQGCYRLSLKPWGIALKFLFLHHENILFPND